MRERHEMTVAEQRDHETLFTCPKCSRKIILKHGCSDSGLVIIDRGDFYALHSGASFPGLVLSTSARD